MPRRDGTGPMGMGAMTGRGYGVCNTSSTFGRVARRGLGLGLGLGLGCRRVFRNNSLSNTTTFEDGKDLLNEEKAILEDRLEEINKQLNTL